MIRVVLLAVLLGLLLYGGRLLWRTWAPRLAGQWQRVALYGAGLGLLILAVSGRLGLLIASLGAAAAYVSRNLPGLLRWLPVLQRLWRQARVQAGAWTGADVVETAFLRMNLRDASAVVLAGRFAGKPLAELSLGQLLTLYSEWRLADERSAELLEAYLDRVHGREWRRVSASGQGSGGGKTPPAGGKMTREEAGKVLGVPPAAGEKEVIAAHRRLMQKFHPDRGGSDYLAAKINLAKDVLLRK